MQHVSSTRNTTPAHMRPLSARARFSELSTLIKSGSGLHGAAGEGSANPQAVRGLYMYGGVGCGKTMLMDLLVASAPREFQVRARAPGAWGGRQGQPVCRQAATLGPPAPPLHDAARADTHTHAHTHACTHGTHTHAHMHTHMHTHVHTRWPPGAAHALPRLHAGHPRAPALDKRAGGPTAARGRRRGLGHQGA
jgi:predicted ATPase